MSAKRRKTESDEGSEASEDRGHISERDKKAIKKKICDIHKNLKGSIYRGVYKGDSTLIIADGDPFLGPLRDAYPPLKDLAEEYGVKFRYGIDMEVDCLKYDYYNSDNESLNSDGETSDKFYDWKPNRTYSRDFISKGRPSPTRKTLAVEVTGETKTKRLVQGALSKFVFRDVLVKFKCSGDPDFDSSYEEKHVTFTDDSECDMEEYSVIVEMQYKVQFKKSYTLMRDA